MKIYGLTPANFFAAIVIGLIISFVAVTLCAPTNKEVEPNPILTPVVQPVQMYYSNDGTMSMILLTETLASMWYLMPFLFIITFAISLIQASATSEEYY